MGNGREIRDIALALARLNQALKAAGLGPAACIGLPVDDLRALEVLPKSLDYMTVEERNKPGPIKIAGVGFIAYERAA